MTVAMSPKLIALEDAVLNQLKGRFTAITDFQARMDMVNSVAKTLNPAVSTEEIQQMFDDMNDMGYIKDLLVNENIEDIMINNTQNIFVFDSEEGKKKIEDRFVNRIELERFVNRLKLYATNESNDGNILDVHLPNGSRVNIISSPLGYDITIRNFKKTPLSIIDLINDGELDYSIAARLWLYIDGFKIRPANVLIGGMPAAGKTTLLNAMFSFFRPEQRVVTIEETYELDTSMQENAAKLETSEAMPLESLVRNVLRMRPDTIIIGEVRGAEANDMITAMNIGKIVLGTIHASSTRDIINRLQHTPMNVPMDIIPVIDVLIVISVVYMQGKPHRRVTQISEVSGMENQVLLSDLYKFDYKTMRGTPILPSVTYRDLLSKLLGVPAPDILAEERVRAAILERLNKLGKKDIGSISQTVKEYYDDPEQTLRSLGLGDMQPVIRV
ncbi:MAG TPA: ATPase, T2SS/T4P/T4SS family [Candidatus Acidoferrales bacterium]|nr:ATPase, T2SS/T4P/T4SS family [Candidatus Acidoferrales bacterium]